jgi:DNA mismatch repair protein MutS
VLFRSLRRGLDTIPEVQVLCAAAAGTRWPLLDGMPSCSDAVGLVAAAIEDDPPATLAGGGTIRRGFSAELDELWSASHNAREWIANLERAERERTGIKSLKVGYNKIFGYYVEVTNPNVAQVPAEYIRKQTVSNAERYVTPELKEREALILGAQERMLELEETIFREVCMRLAAGAGAVLDAARRLAELDVYAALAEVAVVNRYVRPQMADDDVLDIKAGRHPVVERTMRSEPFAPNDTRLSLDEQIIVLTGPNMAGKSTYLRQTALIVLMAQIGSFVPADAAYIGLVDRIFTRIGWPSWTSTPRWPRLPS